MSLEMNHVTVSFSGIQVLKNVNLKIKDGEIHGLLGANGSGKSTLIKVLTGNYHPDKNSNAEIIVDGIKNNDIVDSTSAYELGIRAVHQESPLFDDFTVAECIAAFKGYPKKNGKIDWKLVREYAVELLKTYAIGITPETLINELTAAQRNMLSIAFTIGSEEELIKTKVLILDEAEASIPEAETDFFLDRMRLVAQKGIPIIMISHRLKSVMKYCDSITILNDGEVVLNDSIDKITEEIIVENMVRRNAKSHKSTDITEHTYTLRDLWKLLKKESNKQKGDTVLELKHVFSDTLKDLEFDLKAGEILGIIGITDSGVGELPQILGGIKQRSSGEYKILGKSLPLKINPNMLIKNQIALLPSDRPKQGGVMLCNLRENLLMPNEKQYWNKKKLAKAMINMSQELFDIQPYNSSEKLFETFSGGNQQKAIMAKWLSLRPAVFILDNPTYGIDPASRKRMYDLIKESASMNVGIIIFSTEPEQIVDLCSRIIVLKNGKVECEFEQKDGALNRENITKWSYI